MKLGYEENEAEEKPGVPVIEPNVIQNIDEIDHDWSHSHISHS